MNRNLSETAKVFGVDAALVKQWTILFKDCLSKTANPPKGVPRTFGDSDLLVLCYVWHEWEEAPDIEAIKIGLNRENHYEAAFVEHVYLHTPLVQEPPDDLDETWRHGILLCGGGRHEYLELARNYRHVAESMLRMALEKSDVSGQAYPVLFAYRHTLELYLKLIGEIDIITHSLARCLQLVEKRQGVKLPAPIRGWILELDEIDPAGTAFRYADEKVGSNTYGEHWFDFHHFKFAMQRVFDVLDTAILRTGARGRSMKRMLLQASSRGPLSPKPLVGGLRVNQAKKQREAKL